MGVHKLSSSFHFMADDIEDDFSAYEASLSHEYGSEAASVVIKDTGKRGRGTDDYQDDAEEEEGEENSKKKKRKKHKANQSSKFVQDRNEVQTVRNGSLAEQASLLQRIVGDQAFPLSEHNFVQLSGVDRRPEDLQEILTAANNDLQLNLGAETEAGSPTVLIISASAQGCLPFISAIKGKQNNDPKSKKNAKGKSKQNSNGSWNVIKLFAKHLKISDQLKELAKPVSIGVGTPNRIQQLISQGALSLTHCRVVMIDLTENVKRQTILDVKDTKADLLSVLLSSALSEALTKSTKFALF